MTKLEKLVFIKLAISENVAAGFGRAAHELISGAGTLAIGGKALKDITDKKKKIGVKKVLGYGAGLTGMGILGGISENAIKKYLIK